MTSSTRRTVAGLVWVTAGGLVLSACSGTPTPASSTPALAASQVFVWPNEGVSDIKTLDPGLSTDLNSINAIDLYTAGPVDLNQQGQPVPGAAQSWDISADHLTYTFHLRPGLKFSDGTPARAQDFVDSINRALNPGLGSVVAMTYEGDIKGAAEVNSGKATTATGLSAPDDSTLVVTLAKPVAYFLSEFTYSTSNPIAKSSYDPTTLKVNTDKPVGIGPFVISSYSHNVEIDFTPSPYWYEGKTKLTEIRMPFIQDLETGYKEYQAGQVMVATVTSQHAATDKSKPDYHNIPALWTDAIYINWATPPFDNPKVRLAFAEAIDINTLDNIVLQGTVKPTHQWIPPGMPGYFPSYESNPVWKYDPAKAKADLAAAGFPGGQGLPPVTYVYEPTGPDAAKSATAIQSMWKQNLGVSVQLNQKTFNQVLADDSSGALAEDQLFALAWIADYPDPHDWTTLLWHSGVPYNTTAFVEPQFDALVDKGDLEADHAKRLQDYHDAEKILLGTVGIIPVDNNLLLFRVSPKVHGFILNPQDLALQSIWSNVYITQ
jgi:peptide/nickel transport system substrate-binding protein/oligopeptide transport system substrate-binding protein